MKKDRQLHIYSSWRACNLTASHHLSLVQWTTCLFPVVRDPGSIPRGVLCETGILLLALSCYIGDPDVIDHCGLVWGRLRPEPSLGCRGDSFTTDIVGCWGEALWRACYLTAFTLCLTGPVDYPFASRHEGPRFSPHGDMWNWDSPVSVVSVHDYEILQI